MTTLVQISANQTQKETTANENFTAVQQAGAFGKKHTTTTLSGGLTFGYYGATLNVDGTLTVVADGTLSLQTATTNYIQRNRAGTVTSTTAGFVAGFIPLWEVVTNASSAISSYTDRRSDVHPQPSMHTNVLSRALSDADYTLVAADWGNEVLRLSGTLTAQRNVTVPTVKKQYGIVNATAQTLVVKTSAGSGISIAASRAAIVLCDGTHVIRLTGDTTFTT